MTYIRRICPSAIQRCFIEHRPAKEGIGSFIRLDYMGASEFEWGRVPRSLKRIRQGFGEYKMATGIPISYNGKTIVIDLLCKEEDRGEITSIIHLLAADPYTRYKEPATYYFQLCEPCRFDYLFSDKEEFGETPDFWWDIDNDFMWWIHDFDFATNLIKEIEFGGFYYKSKGYSPTLDFDDLFDKCQKSLIEGKCLIKVIKRARRSEDGFLIWQDYAVVERCESGKVGYRLKKKN